MEPPKANTTGIGQSSNVSMAPEIGARGQNSAMTRGGNRKPMLSASGVPAMHVGLDDEPDETVPEPSPSPMPGPPPVPEDMEHYNEEVGEYWEEHDAWEKENNEKSEEQSSAQPKFINQADYDKELDVLTNTKGQLEDRLEDINTKLSVLPMSHPDYKSYVRGYHDTKESLDEVNGQIKTLKEQRVSSVNIDPKFNTTALISKQSTLGTMPFGSVGNAADNCCGAVAVHNSLILLGGQSNFADVYTYFNDDSKLNLGSLAGGTLGTSPFAVIDYLNQQGRETSIRDFNTEELEKPGVYILVFGWQNESGKIGAHYQAVESDGQIVKTYNEDKLYDLSIDDPTDNRNIENIKSDLDMLGLDSSWLLNVLAGPLQVAEKLLTRDDTYFCYLIEVN